MEQGDVCMEACVGAGSGERGSAGEGCTMTRAKLMKAKLCGGEGVALPRNFLFSLGIPS